MIEARLTVPHAPERVFEFLSDLRNHWKLEDTFVELGGLEGDEEHGPTGGRVRLKGPLGVSRVARTRVLAADAPGSDAPATLAGRAEVGRTTVGRVGWEIARAPEGGSAVTLWARVERASLLDRLLLALGGRRWLRQVFERALLNLSRVLGA